jgi:hypothetical protein
MGLLVSDPATLPMIARNRECSDVSQTEKLMWLGNKVGEPG